MHDLVLRGSRWDRRRGRKGIGVGSVEMGWDGGIRIRAPCIYR